ncbi:MAG: response regulator [Candidatus Aminicenantes bacterium]|nr:MAG: response regulator [Candidatus Aminicenantes bacterium]
MDKEKVNIYIVDDDEPVRHALSRLLRSCGFHVLTFSSAQEFLDSVSPDAQGCLILDVKMSGMDGLELQEKLNSSGWKLPIIFITAYETPQDRKKALVNGAIAFLQKPLNDKDLLDGIHSALESSE